MMTNDCLEQVEAYGRVLDLDTSEYYYTYLQYFNYFFLRNINRNIEIERNIENEIERNIEKLLTGILKLIKVVEPVAIYNFSL